MTKKKYRFDKMVSFIFIMFGLGWGVSSFLICIADEGPKRAKRPQPPRSGIEFVSPEIRAFQEDDFSSPAMLWATRGEHLWQETAGPRGESCQSCHHDAAQSMKGVSARYPKIDEPSGALLNVEARINRCRTEKQKAAAFAYDSESLLALTAYVGLQSRGMEMKVTIDEKNKARFESGQRLFSTRIGQMNLACTNCHDDNYGRKLLNDTISQGHINAYPAYRIEWQDFGSLHRRLRACFYGVRAQLPTAGSDELLDLELFLAWRSQGLPVETPGVRR
jgi:sulfur-oxidizing protein SoxA